ncbi:hypothetical protein KP509_33G059800 [Ceratopteris richardii]|nr:hypothetical protein KP509_33G059800 [Ceratopteris richardii]
MLLGKGSHGCVYKAVLRSGMQVAVKRPSYGRRMLEDEAAFDNEIRILSKLNNPRFVRLLGFSQEPGKEKLLVVELMHNGNLHDLLHETPQPISWSKRVHVAIQIAKALRDIHSISPPLIHRDIKSSNILVDNQWNAKLGDFGLALCCHESSTSTPPAGTLGYLDPEYITPDMLSTKNDVFSYGILLLEIMSGRQAIDMNHNPPSIVEWSIPLIKSGDVLAVCDPRLAPPKCIASLKQMALLAAKCVRDRSSRRPEMTDVVEQLQEISRKIEGSSMWNGIVYKMRRTYRSKQQVGWTEDCKAPSLWHRRPHKKGIQRNLKVYDEDRTLQQDRKPSDSRKSCKTSLLKSNQPERINGSLQNSVSCLEPSGKGRLSELFREVTLTSVTSNQASTISPPMLLIQCHKAVQQVASKSG